MRKSHRSDFYSFGGSSYNLNELTMYLASNPLLIPNDEEDAFDLLAWWKSFKTKFPPLSAMARDIIIILTSIVA